MAHDWDGRVNGGEQWIVGQTLGQNDGSGGDHCRKSEGTKTDKRGIS